MSFSFGTVMASRFKSPSAVPARLGSLFFQLVSIIAGGWTGVPLETKNPRQGAGLRNTILRVARCARLRGGLPLGTCICEAPKSTDPGTLQLLQSAASGGGSSLRSTRHVVGPGKRVRHGGRTSSHNRRIRFAPARPRSWDDGVDWWRELGRLGRYGTAKAPRTGCGGAELD